MESSSLKTLFAHPLILASIGFVVLIAAGSGAYYVFATRQIAVSLGAATATTTQAITATGEVGPAQSPDLAFESAGRVARLSAAVGDAVSQGQVLASLDVATLIAERAQAQASVAIERAKLESLKAGAQPQDIAASQAALDKTTQDLANLYASIADASEDAYAKASDAVSTQLDPLFSNADTNPKLTYVTANSQAQIDAEAERYSAGALLRAWQGELANTGRSDDGLEALLHGEIGYLATLRQMLANVSTTLAAAPISSASTLAAYKADVSAALNEVNTAGKNLDTISQQIASQKTTVAQAQAQLALKQAGPTVQDIAAQQAAVSAAAAGVAHVNAQIQGATVVAPFSGTVASVHVKLGDIVAPDTLAVSLNPHSALQISAYVSEADAVKIAPGASADATLDAYGANRHFPAIVVSVDRSPTLQDGVPAYKVTLQFTREDPAISSGMTANVVITP